jgi:hypothetical protein
MPAKGPGYGSSGRVGGGAARGASMRGSAPKAAPKSKPATTYHGTSWKYKPGDTTKSSSATTSYRTAEKYSKSNRAGRGPWPKGTGPDPKASGKPTVYRVTSENTSTSSRKYRTTKKEVTSPSGWKIEGKAKPPKTAMRAAAKKGAEGPKKSVPKKK